MNSWFRVFFFLVLGVFSSKAQSLLQQVSLTEQINDAALIVDAKVIRKQSVRVNNTTNIVTKNTLKLLSIYQGQVTGDTLTIITKGGSIGFETKKVYPSLQLSVGDEGIFILKETNLETTPQSTTVLSYKPVASLQSFFKFDLLRDRVSHPFYDYETIALFEEDLERITGTPELVSLREVALDRASKTLETPILRSFTPTSARAGIGDRISLIGSDFGDTQGIISFKNADDGGASFKDAFDTAIVSWSDTQIIVEVPSTAGTGEIQITNATGESAFSERVLTVLSAETSAEFESLAGEEFRVKLYNADDLGGYTWTFEDNFSRNQPAVDAFTRAMENWVCETGISWIIGNDTFSGNGDLEEINLITFKDAFDSPNDDLEPGVLAVTTTSYLGCQNGGEVTTFVSKVDISFASNFEWYYGEDTPANFQNDFQGTATHELGHAHNLGHVIAPSNLMHFETETGENSATRIIDEDSAIGAQLNYDFSKTEGLCGEKTVNDRDCANTDTLGIEEAEIKVLIENNGALTVLNSKSIRFLGIFDMQGRKVIDSDVNQLNIDFLSTGVYILVLEDETGALFVQKMVRP